MYVILYINCILIKIKKWECQYLNLKTERTITIDKL